MSKQSAGRSETTGNIHKMAHKHDRDEISADKSLLPPGSWRRVTVGVAAAAGGGLAAAAMLGVGPAAIAGVAGYLAYKKLTTRVPQDEKKKHD